ncbi:enhanced intracellular survival protein Eis [Alteribacillus sp. JSM 102045]|uniref:GNAT family N-acetyltransferase n=1 Tax=Alteribacillus sp. JSM 102045 TaxID=1562101 RepID=UPI0035C25E1B
MEIRKIKETEIKQSLELNQFAFQYEMSEEDREISEQVMKPENTWVAAEGDSILSKLNILPTDVFVGGRKMKMGGVSGVATWPESRRNGLVKQLLEASLKDMHDRGHVLSFLYPFSIGFYRKFGWELFCDSLKWNLKKDQLPEKGGIEKGRIARVTLEDWSRINKVYQAFAANYNGAVDRSETWWRYVQRRMKKGHIAVYTNDKAEDTGYIIYKVKENKMTVYEYTALDEEARHQIWRFIANHDSMVNEIDIKPPIDDPMRYFLPDPKITETRNSYFMARIVDIKGFLEQYPLKLGIEKSFTLAIKDKRCDWNDGIFHVTAAPNKNEIKKATETEKKLTMSIRTAAAVFLGYLPVETAFNAGKITGNSEDLQKLKEAVVPNSPFIYDFF